MALALKKSCCVYFGCTNRRLSKNNQISFFKFPANPEILVQWQKNCGNPDVFLADMESLRNRFICEKHFVNELVYESGGRKKLQKHAVPIFWKDSSAVSVELLTENEPSNLEKHLDEPSWRKRKGIIAYRINKVPKLTTESNLTIAAPSEPSTSASTRPLNELESVYLKEEPSSEGVQEEFEPEVNIDSDDFYTGDTFVEPLLYSGTDDLDDTSKLDYIEQIVESKSDLVTLFHNLSQLAKRLDPLDQALFQSKVSNTVFQMKILQLRGTSC